jgi:hypothetical protein
MKSPAARPRTGTLRLLAAGFACLVMVVTAGCASRPSHGPADHRPDRDFPSLGGVSNRSWPFWPQRMRIHPLTQFVIDRKTDHQLLEVRVEFFDPWGHTCKAFGKIAIEIYDADDNDAEATVQWTGDDELDLTDLQINTERYDDVTRTYLFSLEVEDQPLPVEAEIRVYFQAGDGSRLQAAFVLERPPG